MKGTPRLEGAVGAGQGATRLPVKLTAKAAPVSGNELTHTGHGKV